jgi:hypothetical protein
VAGLGTEQAEELSCSSSKNPFSACPWLAGRELPVSHRNSADSGDRQLKQGILSSASTCPHVSSLAQFGHGCRTQCVMPLTLSGPSPMRACSHPIFAPSVRGVQDGQSVGVSRWTNASPTTPQETESKSDDCCRLPAAGTGLRRQVFISPRMSGRQLRKGSRSGEAAGSREDVGALPLAVGAPSTSVPGPR